MDPGAYRDLHPRLYGALLARHGGPNALQLLAAPPLHAGRDVLVQAPTASGKTEAVLVPLLERHVERGQDAPAVLLVSPTRALVNDLARRLRDPLEQVGVDVGRWTGDHHDGGRLHALTVLTPEGLDSRLARAPAALRGVRALVLDELHVVDGTVRGDQLRILVARLRGRLAADGAALQVVAASATVPDPAAMADRYLEAPVHVEHGARRPVRARLVQGRDPATIAATLASLVQRGFRKVLAFVDTREGVEQLAAALRDRPPFGGAVLAHHGSLARPVRLAVEERFRLAPLALCVATSTLEVGLDLGDVDLVALIGPPPDVPALLQRVGRGGRRTEASTAVAFLAGPLEERWLRTLLGAQAEGRWLVDPPALHPGVLVQQAISVAGGRRGGVDPAALLRRLPPDLQPSWSTDRLAAVLQQAVEAGWLLRVGPGPACVLGPRGEAAWRRGQAHGNLGERAAVRIVDGLTGDAVGEVGREVSRGVALGGRQRRVVHQEGEARVVVGGEGPAAHAELPVFGGGAAPRTDAALARAVLAEAGIPVPCRARLDGGETVFHGLGTAGGLLLARVLRDRKVKVRHAGALAVVLEGAPLDDLPPNEAALRWPRVEKVARVLDRSHPDLARRLGLGAFHGALPEDEQRRAVAAHTGAASVEALVRGGLPPRGRPADPALWEEAAWR